MDHICCSPIQRARETAQIVGGFVGAAISVRPGLEEIDVGVHEGRSEEEATLDAVTNFRALAAIVVAHGGALALSPVRLCHNVPAEFAWANLLDNCSEVVVSVAEGVWTGLSWAGIPLEPTPSLVYYPGF